MHYYKVLSDDENYPERWFLNRPQPRDDFRIEEELLSSEQVETGYQLENGERIEVKYVPMEKQHYSLTVLPDGTSVIDSREFAEGNRYEGLQPDHISIKQKGNRVAFLLAALDMPIVTTEVAEIFQEFAPDDIQRFPIIIDQYIEGYEILNAVHTLKCVDEERSGFKKWGPNDGRPDKVGKYRSLYSFTIDPEQVTGHHIFRIWGFSVVLLVSEEIKVALEEIANLGIIFRKVTL